MSSVHEIYEGTSSLAPSEFLSREQGRSLFDRLVRFSNGEGETWMTLVSRYTGSAAWVRNYVHLTRVVSGVDIIIDRNIRGARSRVATSRTDDAGLREAIERAEYCLSWGVEWPEQLDHPPLNDPTLDPQLWSDTSYGMTGDARGDLARRLVAPAEAKGLIAAGELRIMGQATATIHTTGVDRYFRETKVACSMTVRNPERNGSGWAGQTHFDLARIDPEGVGRRAIEKCVDSANPVAIEPGYYTAILEPQAVADLLGQLMDRDNSLMSRHLAESRKGPFAYKMGQSKISQRLLDRRLTIRSDPLDPEGGFIPFDPRLGSSYQPVSWFADGVLRDLWYYRHYAVTSLQKSRGLPMEGSYRLSSNDPPVSVDEMIRTTERGVLVTRLHNVRVLDRNTLVCSGYTRDGLWFIRNGKIDKPIKNFRFLESPLFVLNKVEAIGEPVRVFNLMHAQLVPPIKVRDFSFTSLADAV